MKIFLIVFAGGGLGSALRYFMGRWMTSFYAPTFPLATLVINVSACFILGLVIGVADDKQVFSTSSRLFWAIGFCGGFSTFSTFSQETLTLFQAGHQGSSVVYVMASVVLCLVATLAGQYLAKV
jgi:CrcB protein